MFCRDVSLAVGARPRLHNSQTWLAHANQWRAHINTMLAPQLIIIWCCVWLAACQAWQYSCVKFGFKESEKYVSHNKCWPDLTWPDLTWPPTVLRRKFDNRPSSVMSLWPDLTLYIHIWNFAHICARYSFELYEISRRYRDAFQSYCRKTKQGKKMPPPTAWKVKTKMRNWGTSAWKK